MEHVGRVNANLLIFPLGWMARVAVGYPKMLNKFILTLERTSIIISKIIPRIVVVCTMLKKEVGYEYN